MASALANRVMENSSVPVSGMASPSLFIPQRECHTMNFSPSEEGAVSVSKKKSDRKVKQSGSGRSQTNELVEAPQFDRRAMEGMMRQLIPGLVGNRSKVDTAEQIMYEAFEEPDPRRQVVLAQGVESFSGLRGRVRFVGRACLDTP